jgi:hypothetical protein
MKIEAEIHRNTGREYSKQTRFYVWPKGETVIEGLFNRRDRPTQLFREIALKAWDQVKDQLKKELPEKSWIELSGLRWSRKAGCSCGCSPGFIAQGEGFYGFDVHVTAEVDYPKLPKVEKPFTEQGAGI